MGYGIGAFWDMGLVYCGICEMRLLHDCFFATSALNFKFGNTSLEIAADNQAQGIN